MHLIHNERTKLSASWVNTLAAALIAAGAFAPTAAILYGLSALPIDTGRLLGIALACSVIGFGIHLGARAMLGKLRDDI